MTLEARLEALVRAVEGAAGAALMGDDGLPLAAHVGGSVPGVDLEASWVECVALLAEARRVAALAGGLEGLTLQAGGLSWVVAAVDARHHLVLSLGPGGNAGKGRYLLRLQAPEFRREVAALS